MSAAGMRSHSIASGSYSAAILVTALIVLMLGLLIGPRVPADQQSALCVVNVQIGGLFGTSLNCDSPEFMRLARQPSALLDPHNPRQGRPGFIAAAAALSVPLLPLADVAQKLSIHASRRDIAPGRIQSALAEGFPVYAAYVGLNAGLVLLSFYMLWLIRGGEFGNGSSDAIFISTCFLLAANDVVKAFIWSPHTQIFNIFVPVFAVWTSIRASANALADRRFVFAVGTLAGVGVTAYPLFAVVLPCIFIAGLTAVVNRRSDATLLGFAFNFAIFAVLAMVPEALWYCFVRYKTGGFYMEELAQGQVVWIFAAWKEHGLRYLLAAWIRNFAGLSVFAANQALPLVAMLIAAMLIAVQNWRAALVGLHRQTSQLGCSVLVALMTAALYTSVGLIVPRLAYAIVASVIPLVVTALLGIASGAPDSRRRVLAWSCAAIVVLQSIFTIVKDGPYS